MRAQPEVPGVQHHFIEAGDVRLHYALAGPEDGEPVVLVHGWPQHWYAWRRVIPLLADRFRVMAIDLRGFGWSEAPDSTYEKTELGADVAAFIQAMNLDGVRLAGHDWGGAACFHAALRAPERLRSLTVFAMPPPWATGRPGPKEVAAALAYQPLLATPVVGPMFQRVTPAMSLVLRVAGIPRDGRGTFAAQFREAERARAASRVYRSFLLREVRATYEGPRLTVPTRLIVGAKDPVVTPQLVRGAERNADSLEIEVVEDGGHWLPEQHPELAAQRIAG